MEQMVGWILSYHLSGHAHAAWQNLKNMKRIEGTYVQVECLEAAGNGGAVCFAYFGLSPFSYFFSLWTMPFLTYIHVIFCYTSCPIYLFLQKN